MPVVSTRPDLEALTLTVIADLAAPPERVWELWSDPRQLERWWGPPTWPATFHRHELVPGGASRYQMTGPDGEVSRGWWQVTAVDPPRRLEFIDGFAGDDGEPVDPEDYTSAVITLDPTQTPATPAGVAETAGTAAAAGSAGSGGSAVGGTRMTMVSTFRSAEQLQSHLDMGMVEGLTQAVGQMDALLRG